MLPKVGSPRRGVAAATAVGLLGFAAPSRAADLPGDDDRAAPCRPTIACTADFAPAGTFEIEAGGQTTTGGPVQVASLPLLLKQTLSPWAQLQVGSNGFTVLSGAAQARYFDNVIVGPKLHLADQTSLVPSLAVSAELGLPTFVEAGYERTDDAFFTGYASKDFGWLHADLNLGLSLWQLSSPTAQAWAALSFSATVAGPVGALVEGYGFSDDAPAAPRDGGLRAGLTLTARPWLVFDLGGDAGFFPSTRSATVFAGVTAVPVVLWRPERR